MSIGFISSKSGEPLAREIFCSIQKKRGGKNNIPYVSWINTKEVHFPNGEIKSVLSGEITENCIYVFQQFTDPYEKTSINDNIIALITLLDSIRRNSTSLPSINLVILQYPYSRQDRKIGYEGVSAVLIAKLIELFKVSQVITFDIHNLIIDSFFFQTRFINIDPIPFFIKKIKNGISYDKKNTVGIAVDIGSLKKMKDFSNQLGIKCEVLYKQRDYVSGEVEDYQDMDISIKGKNVFIMDDIISTGGTLIKLCNMLKKQKVRNIFIFISFPFFDRDAIKKFNQAYSEHLFTKIIGTNALYRINKLNYPWYEEISISDDFAEIILNQCS